MNKEIGTVIERRDPFKKYSLSFEDVKKVAKEGVVISVSRTLPSDIYTPVLAYLQLTQGDSSPSFLLESVEGGERIGRYSYIGISPEAGIKVKDNEISEFRNNSEFTRTGDKPIDPLREIEEKVNKVIVKTSDLPPFVGGYVGYLGYEVASTFEEKVPRTNKDVLNIPDAALFNFDSVIAFDHVKHELKVISNIDVLNLNELEKQYKEATLKIDQIVDKIHSPIRFEKSTKSQSFTRNEAKSNFAKEDYKKAIGKIKKYIIAGDVMQVVLSQRWERETKAKPFDIYRALSRVNPSPFMVYFDYKDFQIIGASPELLVKVEDGNISTWPIAGTRPRGKTLEEDKKLGDELQNDEKEKAEHIMLVDLSRNDVGRVSVPGTVKVTRLKEIELFSHVMHMTSEVRGQLAHDRKSLDALRSTFPAGTVSGAPKIRAMQIIDELETEQRGPYAGVIGYVSYNGNIEKAITIRTMVYKDGIVYVQAGGGIVYDSDPEEEFKETQRKAAGSLRAIDLAEEEY